MFLSQLNWAFEIWSQLNIFFFWKKSVTIDKKRETDKTKLPCRTDGQTNLSSPVKLGRICLGHGQRSLLLGRTGNLFCSCPNCLKNLKRRYKRCYSYCYYFSTSRPIFMIYVSNRTRKFHIIQKNIGISVRFATVFFFGYC